MPLALLNIVGLTEMLLGPHTPALNALAKKGGVRRLIPPLPAVTCTVQASMITGLPPREHGIVGNGWYDRELGEVQFWKQSNQLIQGERLWESARRRDPSFTCANVCWWYAMNATTDVAVTPRPMYAADGRKIPDCWTQPGDLRDELQAKLGRFPLFQFWGPGASIESSQWIAKAARHVHDRFRPTLLMVYLPHLDYCLQKYGPLDPRVGEEVAALDSVVGELVLALRSAGTRIMVVSEYGITPVTDAVPVNVALREAGFASIRMERGREYLDTIASRAFAVVDHQVAHVYVRDPGDLAAVADRCRSLEGVEMVLSRSMQAGHGIDHARAGDLVLVAAPQRWFAYGWWLDDRRAPDYARTVDIHRKPGYDPLELFIDPRIRFAKAYLGAKLALRKLGFRALLDVIPLDPKLVRGSHGRVERDPRWQPILIAPGLSDRFGAELPVTAVRDAVMELTQSDCARA